VDYLNPLTINWKYTGGGTTFYDAGASENPVYITLTNPATANMYRTVVHLACSNPGATTSNSAVANTWALFAGPANVTTWDGVPLTYYGTPDGGNCTDTAMLLHTHDGQCHAFASLLQDSIAANGIHVPITRVNPPSSADAFGVKKLIFGGPSSTNTPPYVYLTSDLGLSDPQLNGQNTAPPQAKLFIRHFIVHDTLNSRYCDPSYGTTASDNVAYSANSIDAYSNSSGDLWRQATTTDALVFGDE